MKCPCAPLQVHVANKSIQAMEKLILRSVMYGADKIPDSWFEKVPGGYFKEKKSQENNHRGKSGDNRRTEGTGGRRARAEDFHRSDDRHRPSGHRRRDRRSRSSYDGGDDEDDRYYTGDERQHRRTEKPHRRRRSVDDERRRYDDDEDDRPRRRDSRMNDRPSRGYDSYEDRDRPSTGGSGPPPPNPFSPNSYIPTVGVAGREHPAGQSNANPQASNPASPSYDSPRSAFQPPPQNRAATRKAYVPYSHVYSDPTPPTSSNGQARPTRVDSASPPVAPSPRGYQQNPFAQQAPTAVDAGAGMQYHGQPGLVNPAYNPNYSTRRNMGYDGAQDAPPPGGNRRSRRDYSPSYSDDESRSDLRRTRSESRRKPKHGIGKAFDRSRRGLGYGATGAAAGGLVGSELGSGPAAAVVGAGLGGLGANAIQAKQQ